MGVSAQTVAMMQRVAGGFLSETCAIEREEDTRGSYGEPVHHWALVASDVACRLIDVPPASSGVAVASGAETLKQQYRLIVPVGTTLDADMRVTVSGVVYQVVGIDTALTDRVFRSAVLARRD